MTTLGNGEWFRRFRPRPSGALGVGAAGTATMTTGSKVSYTSASDARILAQLRVPL